MTTAGEYKHGSFCWADLGSPDPAVATRFYGGLFDLSVHHVPLGGGESYTMLRKGGRDVVAIHRIRADQAARGEGPRWLLYVSVNDLDRAAGRALAGGGEVIVAPHEVADSGRMAVLADPCGAQVALWQAGKHVGAGVVGEQATMCWWELNTRDAARSGVFYRDLVGWRGEAKAGAEARYTTFFSGEEAVAGMLQMTAEWGVTPSHWMMYFRVADCDRDAAAALRQGGAILVPPSDIPPVGRFAVLSDPHGAVFSIIQMARSPVA